MVGYDVLQKAAASASAKYASVHVRLSFGFSDLKLWLRPMAVARTPDAMRRIYILRWTKGRRVIGALTIAATCAPFEHHGTSAMTQSLAGRQGSDRIQRSPDTISRSE